MLSDQGDYATASMLVADYASMYGSLTDEGVSAIYWSTDPINIVLLWTTNH